MARVKPSVKAPAGSNITGCNFSGVTFDAKAVATIDTVAQAINNNALAIQSGMVAAQKNAETLAALSKVFSLQHLEINSLLCISNSQGDTISSCEVNSK